MDPIDQYDLNELKLIYLILHAALPDNPQLMDSELLQDMQTWLEHMAKKNGVDVAHHAQWATWFNNGVTLRGI